MTINNINIIFQFNSKQSTGFETAKKKKIYTYKIKKAPHFTSQNIPK